MIKIANKFNCLKVDLTHKATSDIEKIRNDYNIRGVPTIIFLNKDGKEAEERVIGFVEPEKFVERMKNVLK